MDADQQLDPSPDAGGVLPEALDVREARATPRVRALVEVIACSGYPTQLAIGLLISPFGLGTASRPGELTLRALTTLLVLDSFVIVSLVWWFLRAGDESPWRVLFGSRHWTGEAVAGLLLIPLLFALVLVVGLSLDRFVPWMRPPENPFGALVGSLPDVIVLGIVVVLAGGVREEIQRAFILHRFEQYLGGAGLGLICFSLLFGLGHYLQGWSAVVTTTLLGAFWGIVYLRRRSTVAPMVSHGAFNLFQVAFFKLHP